MPAAAYPFNYRKHKCINVNIVLFINTLQMSYSSKQEH